MRICSAPLATSWRPRLGGYDFASPVQDQYYWSGVLVAFEANASNGVSQAGAFSVRPAPLAAGGLSAPITGFSMGPNLLANATFSSGLTDWDENGYTCFAGDPSTTAPDGTGTVSINYSSLGSNCNNVYYPRLFNSASIGPGTYTVSSNFMTNALSGATIGWVLSYGTGWYDSNTLTGTNGWTQEQTANLVVPPGSSAKFYLQVVSNGNSATGEAWVADTSVRQQLKPDLELFLLYPNYRGMMWSDQSQVAQIQVIENNQSSIQPVTVTVTARGSTAPVIQTTVTPASMNAPVSLDMSSLPEGVYTLTGAMNGFTQSPYIIVKLAATSRSSMKAWIDPQNNSHFGSGGPGHFVIGIYDTNGTSNSSTPTISACQSLIGPVAQAPINTMINYELGDEPIVPTMDDYGSVLESYGIYYLTNTNYNELSPSAYPTALFDEFGITDQNLNALITDLAQALSTNTDIVGYYTDDEPDVSLQPSAFQQYQLIRQNDPGSIAFAVLNAPSYASFWRDTLYVLGTDPYPIYYDEAAQPPVLSSVGDAVSQVVQAVYGARPVWAVIQFFQFTSVSAWPTQQQLHDMSWTAIASGASGLFYWSYGAGGLDSASTSAVWEANNRYYLNQLIADSNGNVEMATAPAGGALSGSEPPTWPTTLGATVADRGVTWKVVGLNQPLTTYLYNELINVTKQIKALEPVLLSPTTNILASNSQQGTIITLGKTYGWQRYLVAYNHSGSQVIATFTLAAPTGSVTATAGDSYSLSLSNGRSFTDTFAPYQAHVYQIQ
jgi:hypothetical protein